MRPESFVPMRFIARYSTYTYKIVITTIVSVLSISQAKALECPDLQYLYVDNSSTMTGEYWIIPLSLQDNPSIIDNADLRATYHGLLRSRSHDFQCTFVDESQRLGIEVNKCIGISGQHWNPDPNTYLESGEVNPQSEGYVIDSQGSYTLTSCDSSKECSIYVDKSGQRFIAAPLEGEMLYDVWMAVSGKVGRGIFLRDGTKDLIAEWLYMADFFKAGNNRYVILGHMTQSVKCRFQGGIKPII